MVFITRASNIVRERRTSARTGSSNAAHHRIRTDRQTKVAFVIEFRQVTAVYHWRPGMHNRPNPLNQTVERMVLVKYAGHTSFVIGHNSDGINHRASVKQTSPITRKVKRNILPFGFSKRLGIRVPKSVLQACSHNEEMRPP